MPTAAPRKAWYPAWFWMAWVRHGWTKHQQGCRSTSTVCYWKWLFIVDLPLPMKNGDFPQLSHTYVSLPEGNNHVKNQFVSTKIHPFFTRCRPQVVRVNVGRPRRGKGLLVKREDAADRWKLGRWDETFGWDKDIYIYILIEWYLIISCYTWYVQL